MVDNEQQEQPSSPHQEHDKGYKYLLSSKRVFLQLLRSFVKQGWVQEIDESSLAYINKSYILPDFSDKEADIVYKLKLKDQEIILYILTELQSTVDFQMPSRLLLYQVEIWRDYLKNIPKEVASKKDFRLPAIVPIVLYNGAKPWTAAQHFKEICSGYRHVEEHLLNFQYILIDINEYNKQDLIDMANVISTVFLLDQKGDKAKILASLELVIPTLQQMTPDDFQLIKEWLKHILLPRTSTDMQDEVRQIIDQTKPEEVEQMRSNLGQSLDEMMRKERMVGKSEGKAEGKLEIAQRLILKGMSVEEIAEVTGLSLEQISKLKH